MTSDIVMILGEVRSGSNLVCAIVRKLGMPGVQPCMDQSRKTMPMGDYADVGFNNGNEQRNGPWVFKCHGPRPMARRDWFLSLDNLRVIRTRRNRKSRMESIRRKYFVDHGERILPRRAKSIMKLRELSVCRFASRFSGSQMEIWMEDLIRDPIGNVRRIAEFLDLPFNQDAADIIDPRHVHF